MTLTRMQCRMVRAVLDLSARQLSRRAGLPPGTVTRLENGEAIGTERLCRLLSAIEDAGVILIPEDEAEGAGVRLTKGFRREFIYDRDGKHVASIVGHAVLDPVRDQPIATVRDDGLYTFEGAPLGELGAVDVFQGTGSLPDGAMQLLTDGGLQGLAGLPARQDLLSDES